jgi:hypothetical protein
MVTMTDMELIRIKVTFLVWGAVVGAALATAMVVLGLIVGGL